MVNVDVSGSAGKAIQQLSAAILEKLAKAKPKSKIYSVSINEIANHIGDSVIFCGKVFITRFFQSAKAQATILDFQTRLVGPAARAIIWREDQKKFGPLPKAYFTNKDVCIKGLVYLYDNIPYIQITNPNQITIHEVARTNAAGPL